MKQLILAVLSLTLFTQLPANAQTQNRIGHANTGYIIGQLPDMKRIQGELETTKTQLEKVIQEKMKVFEEKYERFQKNAPSMSEILLTDSQKELEKLQTEIQELQQNSEVAFRTKQQQLLQPLLEKVDNAVKEVGKEKGYLYILNSDTGNVGNPVLLFAGSEETNITDLVLKKLGVTPQATPAPASTPK